MKFSTITLTNAILSVLYPDVANPRPEQFKPHRDVLVSTAEHGYKPHVDAVTGMVDHPVVRLAKGKKLANVLKSPAKGDLTILRGNHRFGTWAMAIGKDLPKGFAELDKAKVAALVDHGMISCVVVEDCNDEDAINIATDDDALKRKWNSVTRYRQYSRLVSCGVKQDDAYRMVGYTSRYQHFDRLMKLPVEVQTAWITGKLDATKPQLTDALVADLYNIQKENKGALNLVPDAKAKFDAIMSGSTVVRAHLLTDKQLVTFAQQLTGTPFVKLLQLVRGYHPDTNAILTDAQRGSLLNEFVAAHGIQLPKAPDDASDTIGEDEPEATKATRKGKKLSHAK